MRFILTLALAAGFRLSPHMPCHARTAATAVAAGKPISPEQCSKTAQAVTEAVGVITLVCTLPPHKNKQHYDGAFSMGWREI